MKTYRIYPTDLSDEQWKCIKKLLPESKRGRPRELELRLVVNAILYVVVGGVQWRMLPRDYPNWQSVYYYFKQWRDKAVWQRIHDALRALVRQQAIRHKHPTAGSIDSQSVKASEYSGVRGFDAAENLKGKKRHILVDTMGLVLAVLVTPACVQDRDGAKQLFKHLTGSCKRLRLIWVDGAYRGKLIDWVAAHCRFRLEPVLRPDEQKGFAILPRRWVVERTFAWLTQYRRLNKDYERLNASSQAFIHIAMIRLMLRRLA